MAAWWQSLSTLEHVLFYIAVPATLILLLQTVLLFVGGASGGGTDAGDLDADPGGDLGPDLEPDLDASLDPDLDSGELEDPSGPPDGADGGLHLLTLRGVVAFLTLFGWGGLWLSQIGLPGYLAVFLAIPIGFAGMVGIALALRQALRLQYDGTLDLRNAVGRTGTVYLTVPARRAAPGKVTVLVQEQLQELDALTDGPAPIPTGSSVRVTGLAGRDTLLVEPISPTDSQNV